MALVLWDGECGLCRRSIEWVERRNPGTLECLPYQQAPPSRVSDALRRECSKAVHVIADDGRVLRASEACLFVLRAIGWRFTPWLLGMRPFAWLAELGYRLVARHRRRLSRLLSR